jgi:hypothetical protein
MKQNKKIKTKQKKTNKTKQTKIFSKLAKQKRETKHTTNPFVGKIVCLSVECV